MYLLFTYLAPVSTVRQREGAHPLCWSDQNFGAMAAAVHHSSTVWSDVAAKPYNHTNGAETFACVRSDCLFAPARSPPHALAEFRHASPSYSQQIKKGEWFGATPTIRQISISEFNIHI